MEASSPSGSMSPEREERGQRLVGRKTAMYCGFSVVMLGSVRLGAGSNLSSYWGVLSGPGNGLGSATRFPFEFALVKTPLTRRLAGNEKEQAQAREGAAKAELSRME